MFPITKSQLQHLEMGDEHTPQELVQDIVVLRIASEIFTNAAKGGLRYSCDIETKDTIGFVSRLIKMFPDCSIEVHGEVSKNWSCLSIKWG